MTQDVDFAQFWGISENIGESMAPPLTILRNVDETFREVPHMNDPFVSTQYRNRARYRVDFLTPNRGADRHIDRPARMKSLGGAGAQPRRHLDYLIHQPERSVLLHSGGVPVTIPRAERYAVHKLIVAVDRQDQAKSAKDIMQAETLIGALATKRPAELAAAWKVAWETGARWREKLEAGRERLPATARQKLWEVAERAGKKTARGTSR
jgi:hypothetical protein